MSKMKTKSAAAKRFSLTATGKVKRRRKGLRHILEKRSQKSKKIAGKTDYISQADQKRVKKLIPYA
ncbi:MAG: 50S ribosomal protein L35 [Bacteriovoracaceae bacterium]|nr:50S ribosomal protein L35 [Bacteriovoracaceae bacterium]